MPDTNGSSPDDVAVEAELLTLTSRRSGAAVIVAAVGEIDLLTAPRLLTALREALDRPGRDPVVCDLTDVTFLASAGLGALIAADEDAAQRRAQLRVVVDHNRPVLAPLHLVGLDRVLALYETVADALRDQERPSVE